MAWTEIRGTRYVNTAGETTVDVQIDFEADVETEPPAHGKTIDDIVGGEPAPSLIPTNHTCTEPEIVSIRQHYRHTTNYTRITVLFRGFKTGA